MYDITSEASFAAIERWARDVAAFTGKHLSMLLVGNKVSHVTVLQLLLQCCSWSTSSKCTQHSPCASSDLPGIHFTLDTLMRLMVAHPP